MYIIEYLKRNPSGFSKLKNMDKYFEQKDLLRSNNQSVFWCFPPMPKQNPSDQINNNDQKSSFYQEDGNFNDSDINENIKQDIESELEKDYVNFPDPLEYLIGFFTTKVDPTYRYQSNSFQDQKQISSLTTPYKKPPISHVDNNLAESQPRNLYKSYYEYKKHNSNSVSLSSNSAYNPNRNKFNKPATSLINSAQKPNMVNKSKVSIDKNFPGSLDKEQRLCHTLGEDEMYASRQESTGRSSIEPYDQLSEQRS